MATYNFDSTGSTEYLPVNLSASEEIVFHVTNSNEGSSYFTIETYPDNNGAYSSNAPKNASGSFVSSSGITTIVSDDYHMSAVVENSGGTITFAPADFVSGSDLKVRGVGARTDYASTIDRWPNAAAAYSLRKLNSHYDGPAVKVRRSVDNEEKDINFIGTSLDTTSLTNFATNAGTSLPSNYGNGAGAAYSLRYVSSIYTGPVVRVRRSSDDVEKDFTPNEVIGGDLETWVGAGNNGLVTIWYDQSGNNRHVSQPIAINQPTIVNSGILVTINGLPSLDFDGSNDNLFTSGLDFSNLDKMNIFQALSFSAYTSNKASFGLSDGTNTPAGDSFLTIYPADVNGGDGVRAYFNGGIILNEGGATRTGQILFNFQKPLVNSQKLFVDSTEIITDILSKTLQTGSHLYIGTNDADQPFSGSIQETIFYPSDQSSNRIDIESNINNYYDIFDYNAYVTTWYDQSGNDNHAIQSTADEQPYIVTASNIPLKNNLPAILFPLQGGLKIDKSFTSSFSGFAVAANNTSSRGDILRGETNDFLAASSDQFSGGVWRFRTVVNNINYKYQDLAQHIHTWVNDGSTSYAATDSEPFTSISSGPITQSALYIGGRPSLAAFDWIGTIQEVNLYELDQSVNRLGIENSLNSHYKVYWNGATSKLLNTYSGSASAYSLRALNQEYTGSLIRVRRSSDNAETDIKATYTGELNIEALESFCNGYNGFVTTWYDQSGNGYDATTTVASRQPQIVSSGTVITENRKPVVKFDGSDDQLVSVFGTTYAQPTYFFLTHNFYSTPSAFDATVGSISVENRLILNQTLNYTLQSGGALSYNSYSPSQSLVSYKIQNSDPKFFFNGVQQSVTSGTQIGTSGLEGVILGGIESGSATGTSPIQIQEFIAYGSDQSSNRTGIESNINSYYNIY